MKITDKSELLLAAQCLSKLSVKSKKEGVLVMIGNFTYVEPESYWAAAMAELKEAFANEN